MTSNSMNPVERIGRPTGKWEQFEFEDVRFVWQAQPDGSIEVELFVYDGLTTTAAHFALSADQLSTMWQAVVSRLT